jgi:hypothetical protein
MTASTPSLARRFLRLAAIAALASFTIAAAGCSSDASVGDEEDEEGAGTTVDPLTAPAAAGPLKFTDACRAGTQITIAAVGDVLLHSPLQVQAYGSPEGHHSLWKHVEPLLARADLTYGNLEGPCADGVTTSGEARDPGEHFDNHVYSSYPQFNYHPSLIGALVSTGFDVVSTANNHAMDRRALGADRTIANLKKAGLPFAGTRPSNDDSASWYTVTEAKGVKVAWVACSFSTNGIPDTKHQVLHCYEDKATLLATIRSLKTRDGIDAVVVTPHWGIEYNHTPEAQEKGLAHELLDAGALVVLGGHPHVVQPWEKYTTRDGREGFVIYSLGNFVSGQSGTDKRSSLILYVGLTKGSDGKVAVNGVRHMPLTMGASPYTVQLGSGDSLALTNRILGSWNKLEATEPLVTNPECRR